MNYPWKPQIKKKNPEELVFPCPCKILIYCVSYLCKREKKMFLGYWTQTADAVSWEESDLFGFSQSMLNPDTEIWKYIYTKLLLFSWMLKFKREHRAKV